MKTRNLFYRVITVMTLLAVLLPQGSPLVPATAQGPGGSTENVSGAGSSDLIVATANATALAAGGYHTCAVTSGGGVKCWGNNYYGQLGDGTTMERHTPVDVIGLSSGVTALAAGGWHTCAVTSEGGVKCWGRNGEGELGDGTTTERHTPVDVSGLSSGVTALAAGWYHSCAVTSGGGVKCWGDNYSGQLGDGTTTNRATPVDVGGLSSDVTALTAGAYYTCALTSGDGVKCWGDNWHGQLGDGTTTERHTPVNVIGLSSGVTALAAGWYHTCAVTSGGGIKSWGDNELGQLGDGTTTERHTPVDVIGLSSSVTALAAGAAHTCTVTSGGGVKCWGNNWYGELGDGTTTERHTPVDVIGLSSGVTALAVGRAYTCALTSGGGVKCWGDNYYGQLGDGTTTDRTTPVDVIGLGGGTGFDFQVEDVWWIPDPPVAMSDSTINVRVRNVGPATYVPNTGDYVIGIKLTDTDKDPDEYWYYRSPGSGVGTLQPNEDRTFQVPKFWFTRPQVDQIEVTFFLTDNDSNTANNVRTETITIQPASDSLLDCLSLALDAVTVYAATHGVDIPVLEAITVNFMLTCAKVKEALDASNPDKAWEAVIGFVVKSGLSIAADLSAKPVKIAITLVKSFVSAAFNAWHCVTYLADVIIGLIDDFNAKGVDINAAFAESPICVVVTNSSNQRVGFLDDGSVVNEIADAEVLQASDERKLILYPGRDTESVVVTGSGAGHFDLTLAIAKTDGSTHNVEYRNVSVFTDTVGTIDTANTAYPLEIDDDGDGTVDHVEFPTDITISWPGMVYLPLVIKNCACGAGPN